MRGCHLAEAARLADEAQRLLVLSFLHLEEACATILPEAGLDIAELIEDANAYAVELLRVADQYGHAEVEKALFRNGRQAA